jgi:hypothetical protein
VGEWRLTSVWWTCRPVSERLEGARGIMGLGVYLVVVAGGEPLRRARYDRLVHPQWLGGGLKDYRYPA